jgi:CHAP domain
VGSSSRARLNAARELPITLAMSIETTLLRVDAIRQALADPATLIGSEVGATGGTEAPAQSSSGSSPFAAALAQASAAYPASAGSAEGIGSGASLPGVDPVDSGTLSGSLTAGQGGGSRVVAAAETQIGQAEQPPGSNESPAIAEYRAAAAGAEPGAPWCAYFVSWAARQAGEPIGPNGEGLGSVSEIWSWAQSTGRAVANGPGVVPRPGELIVFGDEHVGIVKEVLPDGRIATIEGNYENKVAANVRSESEATGYVSMS